MKENLIEKLNTLSEDAQNAAIAKANELKLDLNKGTISLIESFINLNADVATLRDATEKGKLDQIPLSIQNEINTHAENISRLLTGLAGGTDEIVNLVNAIEALHALIWVYGLQKLSDEYIGYESKLNQIKHLEVKLRGLQDQLGEGLATKSRLEALVASADETNKSLSTQLASLTKSASSAEEQLVAITKTKTATDTALDGASKNEKGTADQLEKVNANTTTVVALEKQIKDFFDEIVKYKDTITKTTERADTTVNTNNDKVTKLTTELKALEDQIKEQIRRATGHSLFHSFQTRQTKLASGKMFWIYALLLLVGLSAWFSFYLAGSTTTFDKVFYIKLSLTIPLVFAITFCTVQYSRERRLEEEYAFKSSISISLVPYQELVEKLVDKTQAAEREKFAAFIIDAVTKVFTSPTDKIFDTPEKDSSQFDKSLKRAMTVIKPIIKGLKH